MDENKSVKKPEKKKKPEKQTKAESDSTPNTAELAEKAQEIVAGQKKKKT